MSEVCAVEGVLVSRRTKRLHPALPLSAIRFKVELEVGGNDCSYWRGLPLPTLRALSRAGLRTLADLRAVSAMELVNIPGVGVTMAERLAEFARLAGIDKQIPLVGVSLFVVGEIVSRAMEAADHSGQPEQGPRLLASAIAECEQQIIAALENRS